MAAVLLSRRWLALHALAIVLIAACSAMTWWQFVRAQGGNPRSIGYAFQWPGIGIFTVGVWVWLCRDAVRGDGDPADAVPRAPDAVPGRVADELVLTSRRPAAAAPPTDDEDPALAQYNRMLAKLAGREQR